VNRLKQFPIVYLATPYTKYLPGIDAAFRDAASLAARLLKRGVRVYSPIAHCHPMAQYGGIDPKDHSIWLPYQEAMMAKADAVLVAQLQDWHESYGIDHEINFFITAGKPVFYLDTVLNRVGEIPWEIE
jgi:nucleoside 2-deoxyribosyltransferase